MKLEMRKKSLTEIKLLLFCIPACFVYVLFWVLPGLANIPISFTDWSATKPLSSAQYVKLSNYKKLFGDELFWNALGNNIVYGVFTVIIITILALFLALMVERGIHHFKGVFRTIFFIPIILPWIVVALIWRWLYDPSFGVINALLTMIGLEQLVHNWLGDPKIALYSIVAVAVWKSVGFHMIIFIAGLQGIPKELEEAAHIDGAGSFGTLLWIIIPQLRAIIGIVSTLILIDAFRVFEVIFIMTEGGPGYYSTDVLSTYIYRTAFQFLQQSYASTLAIALFFFVATLSLFSYRNSTGGND